MHMLYTCFALITFIRDMMYNLKKEEGMALVKGGDASFFSEETYQAFLRKKISIHNERLRGDNETIFDAVLSEEADFTKHPEGEQILNAIRNFESDADSK